MNNILCVVYPYVCAATGCAIDDVFSMIDARMTFPNTSAEFVLTSAIAFPISPAERT